MIDDPKRPAIVFFDVNETLLDLSPLKESFAQVMEGRGDLLPLWFTTVLQYSLVETVTRSYRDLDEIATACLVMVAGNHGIDLDPEGAKKAIEPLQSLPAHPDAEPALAKLKEAGFRLATLTNSPQKIMEEQLANAGLSGYFTKQLSVSAIETFKPHVATYQWAGKQMGATPADCMMIAAHGWDIAGALRAGMRGVFVSRPGSQPYPLVSSGEFTAPDLMTITNYLIELWEGGAELESGGIGNGS